MGFQLSDYIYPTKPSIFKTMEKLEDCPSKFIITADGTYHTHSKKLYFNGKKIFKFGTPIKILINKGATVLCCDDFVVKIVKKIIVRTYEVKHSIVDCCFITNYKIAVANEKYLYVYDLQQEQESHKEKNIGVVGVFSATDKLILIKKECLVVKNMQDFSENIEMLDDVERGIKLDGKGVLLISGNRMKIYDDNFRKINEKCTGAHPLKQVVFHNNKIFTLMKNGVYKVFSVDFELLKEHKEGKIESFCNLNDVVYFCNEKGVVFIEKEDKKVFKIRKYDNLEKMIRKYEYRKVLLSVISCDDIAKTYSVMNFFYKTNGFRQALSLQPIEVILKVLDFIVQKWDDLLFLDIFYDLLSNILRMYKVYTGEMVSRLTVIAKLIGDRILVHYEMAVLYKILEHVLKE